MVRAERLLLQLDAAQEELFSLWQLTLGEIEVREVHQRIGQLSLVRAAVSLQHHDGLLHLFFGLRILAQGDQDICPIHTAYGGLRRILSVLSAEQGEAALVHFHRLAILAGFDVGRRQIIYGLGHKRCMLAGLGKLQTALEGLDGFRGLLPFAISRPLRKSHGGPVLMRRAKELRRQLFSTSISIYRLLEAELLLKGLPIDNKLSELALGVVLRCATWTMPTKMTNRAIALRTIVPTAFRL